MRAELSASVMPTITKGATNTTARLNTTTSAPLVGARSLQAQGDNSEADTALERIGGALRGAPYWLALEFLGARQGHLDHPRMGAPREA